MQHSALSPSVTPYPAGIRLGRIARLLLASGIVFLLAGAAIFATSSHLAWGEQNHTSQFQPVECLVLKRQLNWQVKQVDQQQEFFFRPQLLVSYTLRDTEIEAWIDIGPETDISGHLKARRELEEFPTQGDTITCWYDGQDPTTLHYQIGDGGRRTLVTGLALGLFTLLPGAGLLIAALLLWRQR